MTKPSKRPKNFKQLFEFYHEYVKLLYSASSAENVLPQEVLFEINAAFDHIARHWQYKESQESVVSKAASHLKRSCFDLFKITLKDTLDLHKELQKIDTSIIDNGEFDKDMHKLIREIKSLATHARQQEGINSQNYEDWAVAFEEWLVVYDKCEEFKRTYYHNDKVQWARRKDKTVTRKTDSVLSTVSDGITPL